METKLSLLEMSLLLNPPPPTCEEELPRRHWETLDRDGYVDAINAELNDYFNGKRRAKLVAERLMRIDYDYFFILSGDYPGHRWKKNQQMRWLERLHQTSRSDLLLTYKDDSED